MNSYKNRQNHRTMSSFLNCRLLLHLVAAFVITSPVSSFLTSTTLFSSSLPARCPSPPCVCHVDAAHRKHVTCATLGMTSIPISKMDPETQILNVTAPPGIYNSISLGRIFLNLTQLSEVHITRSRLPAIGRSTFCPSSCSVQACNSSIRVLNLSDNSLAMLREDDFNCLNYLEILDLSDNQLQEVPSAVFRQLSNLSKLSLARNKLTTLVPLMFYGLLELRELDLSNNPLTDMGSDALNNVLSVERLMLQSCQLTKIESNVFNSLPNLEYLDLSDNRLKHFDPDTFNSLEALRVLRLSGNSITVLSDNIFTGLNLDLLDLSENLINPLTTCTFCGSKIKHLDLSGNKLTSFNPSLLEPIALSLERLYLDRNRQLIDPPSSLVALLQPLRRLRVLSVVDLKLNETLPESVFDGLRYLTQLNMSRNAFHELSGRLISSLANLDTLDVSHNQLTFLDPSALQMISRMQYLERVFFQENPFSCYRCHILPFIDWLNSDPPAYWAVCGKLTSDPERLPFCARCDSPESLQGRYLHEQDLHRELEWCTNPEVQLRLTASEPQVGLILAFLIILSLVAVILVVVAIYRKHGAVYYTQEDKFASSEKIYTGGGHPNIGWTHTSATTTDGRIQSLTSTQYSTSRQNTTNVFSPQSSLEQQTGGVTNGGGAHNGGAHNHQHSLQGVCDSCANSTAVKQVIASIPAMTEMLEQSLNSLNHHATNGTHHRPNGGVKSPPLVHPKPKLVSTSTPSPSPSPQPPVPVLGGTATLTRNNHHKHHNRKHSETEATQTEGGQPPVVVVESVAIQTSGDDRAIPIDKPEITTTEVVTEYPKSPKPSPRTSPSPGPPPPSPTPTEEAPSNNHHHVTTDPADVHIYI